MENTEEKSEKIGKIWKKDQLNSEMVLENMEERQVELWSDMENIKEK